MGKARSDVKKNKKGLAFSLGNHYLHRNIALLTTNAPHHYILSQSDRKKIRKLKLRTYTYSGLIGAVAVLLVILPFHVFDFFQPQHFELFEFSFDFELYYNLYGLIMIFPEIWLLNVVNIRAVKRMCEIHQYPNARHPDYAEQIEILTEAGLEMPNRLMEKLEIDPYIGLSKFSYYLLFAVTKLKAALSNVLMKLLIRRLLGRYALRIVMDLAGIPVYAFWDAWASRQVLKEAQLRLMASSASKEFVARFTKEELATIEDVYPLLVNYIAQQKRAYNFALYAFIKELSQNFDQISLKVKHEISLNEFFGDDSTKNEIIARLLIFGFIVDGTLSIKERMDIHKLGKNEWFPLSMDEIETMLEKYLDDGER